MSAEETLTIDEIRILIDVAAIMFDEDLIDPDGTHEKVLALCEKASRMRREGYVAMALS